MQKSTNFSEVPLWYKEMDHYVVKMPKANAPKKEEKMNEDLYEIYFDNSEETHFGTKLAVNSKGQWVMEVKGSGAITAVDPKNVRKVVPFTVGIQFGPKGTVYHYLAEEGEYKLGDFLIVDGYSQGAYQIAHVVEVDSQSDRATKELKYYKKIS